MFRKHSLFIVLVVIASVTFACSTSGIEPPPATPDTQATVDAAIAATSTAQAEMQAQIDVAVEATITAMPPSTVTAMPPPTEEIPAEYLVLTEEELAAMIDAAVDETAAASEAANTEVTEATADGTVTQEEYDEMIVYADDLEYAIELAEELIYAYYGVYGELAADTLYLLTEVEDDLDDMAALTLDLVEILIEVEDALNGGLEISAETIAQLQMAAESAQEKLADMEGKSGIWVAELQAEMETRAAGVMDITPSEIPGDRKEAILSAFDYIDAVRAALLDNQFSLSELSSIAQLGANAMAGLEAHGGPKLQGLSGNIGAITSQLAHGQMPHAANGLGALEGALGTRPGQ
ncbi:MAG: hypothetical protein KKD28_11055 [Chloroflexi bacterium]|nr:hypothetical protein [Chloroflexota bacterium]